MYEPGCICGLQSGRCIHATQSQDCICELQGDFVTTDGSEYALKEALYTKGPMTVSVDAGPDSFVFYSSGIYNNTACHSDYKGEGLLTVCWYCCSGNHSCLQ